MWIEKAFRILVMLAIIIAFIRKFRVTYSVHRGIQSTKILFLKCVILPSSIKYIMFQTILGLE